MLSIYECVGVLLLSSLPVYLFQLLHLLFTQNSVSVSKVTLLTINPICQSWWTLFIIYNSALFDQHMVKFKQMTFWKQVWYVPGIWSISHCLHANAKQTSKKKKASAAFLSPSLPMEPRDFPYYLHNPLILCVLLYSHFSFTCSPSFPAFSQLITSPSILSSISLSLSLSLALKYSRKGSISHCCDLRDSEDAQLQVKPLSVWGIKHSV